MALVRAVVLEEVVEHDVRVGACTHVAGVELVDSLLEARQVQDRQVGVTGCLRRHCDLDLPSCFHMPALDRLLSESVNAPTPRRLSKPLPSSGPRPP